MSDGSVITQGGERNTLNPNWLSQVRIRHALKADLPSLEWEGEYSRYRKVYAGVFQKAMRGEAVMWVADSSSVGLIGQALVQLRTSGMLELAEGTRRAYVHSFRVREAFRRAGLGKRLMKIVEDDLRDRNFSEITLNAQRENLDALRLYRNLGYSVVRKDPGIWFYHDENDVLQEVEEPGWRLLKILE